MVVYISEQLPQDHANHLQYRLYQLIKKALGNIFEQQLKRSSNQQTICAVV